METAGRHGVAPLLYQHLSAFRQNIPPGVFQELREGYLHNSWKNTRRYYKLAKILADLRSRDIPAIVLKGAALAGSVYENIALRPMGDVDLLIRSEDVWKVDQMLSSEYENTTNLLSKRHARWVKHLTYRDENTHIEIHLKIPELPELDPWMNAAPAKVASIDTLILGTEDFLLHLCLHLDQHLHGEPSRLIWWCDIAGFLKLHSGDINWDYVIRTAREYQVEGAIRRVLWTIHENLADRVPSHVLDQLKDDGITISISDVLDFRSPLNPEPESLLPVISEMPLIRTKIYHILRLAFPSKEYLIHRYSITRSRSIYLYYFRTLAGVGAKSLGILCQLPGYLRRLKSNRSGGHSI
jgi:hypothetical protein